MQKRNQLNYKWLAVLLIWLSSCAVPAAVQKKENKFVPPAFAGADLADCANSAMQNWRLFFEEPPLIALIDTALANNQELNMLLQEIEISRNEVRARKGEYLPSVGIKAGVGMNKVPRYTNIGALEANTEIKPGKKMPEPLGEFGAGAYASWELDIWRKLRNATKAANLRYLASVEGKNFMTTNLVAEIASTYYELLALDKQRDIILQNIDIQTNALTVVKVQKEATRVTELAVQRFDAQLADTKAMLYIIQQKIIETENKINFLLGRYPQPIYRNDSAFKRTSVPGIQAGIPAALLSNRPDIRQSELALEAAKLDVKVARAQFYPSVGISSAVGLGAFNPSYLIKAPESILFSLAGDLAAPLVNRNGIKAAYANANARQLQAVYQYEQTILKAYLETSNQLSNISNLEKSYAEKFKQSEDLKNSIIISNNLFNSARADYMEVLLTQRDAVEARFELVETKLKQLHATVKLYQALGGGWR